MKNFLEKNHKNLVVAVFIIAAILIFTGLTRADVQTDEAAYSLRALGWLDYMDTTNLQTTPIQWFDEAPFWSKLSFHDAPPLVFAIQHIFFQIFGSGEFGIRLPFALAGFGSVVLLYFLTKELYDRKTALAASFTLSVLSYHSWASKVGYLEPIATFFILLTLYLFVLSLKDYKKFTFFGLSLGLMMMTKYTTFFVIPVILIYLLVSKKEVFKNKHFWLSGLIALIIISPVIFYNIKMYQERGHFDVQFSKLLGQDISEDWPGLAGSGSSKDYFNQSLNVWRLTNVMSLPMYLVFLASLIYLIITIFQKDLRDKNLLLFLLIVFLTLTFAFVGTPVRFLSILNPFVALTIALLFVKIIDKFSDLKKSFQYILSSLLVLVFILEIFYNINTNVLEDPLGRSGLHYSTNRLERLGFSPLEDYLLKDSTIGSSVMLDINSADDLLIDSEKDLFGKDVVVFDPNLRWFSTLWHFRRFGIYHKDVLNSATDMAGFLPIEQWQDFFRASGVKNLYYIRGEHNLVFDPGAVDENNQIMASRLEEYISYLGGRVTRINNAKDELAFKVYKLNLN